MPVASLENVTPVGVGSILLLDGAEMLDHEFELPMVEVRDGGTVAFDPCSGDDPASDGVVGGTDVRDLHETVRTGCGVPE